MITEYNKNISPLIADASDSNYVTWDQHSRVVLTCSWATVSTRMQS